MNIVKVRALKNDACALDIQNGYKTENYGKANALFVSVDTEFFLNSENGVNVYIDIPEVRAFMSDYRHAEFWCRPWFGKCLSEIPDNTQGLIIEQAGGKYTVILPVVSKQYKCVLAGNEDNTLCAKLFSWYENLKTCNCLAFTYAEGENPYELLKECAALGVKLLGNGCKLRGERKYPEIFEYLGWCSWDAFEIRVSEQGITDKCKEFKEKEIPVKWAIFDDMWAEVRDFWDKPYDTRQEMFALMHSSRLYSYKADSRRFPNGLKACIDKVNQMGIKVGMWHPTTGYWMGIDKNGDFYNAHKDLFINVGNETWLPSYEEEKAYGFYKVFHDYLKESGAEFVKIDNQSMTRRFYKKYAPVGEVARSFHSAMERSVNEHFGGRMINCMGMASEDMWNRSESPLSRCSDDFQPEDREWFTKHILQCTYNCLVQGQFYYCDYDMWWTDDGQATKNSLLRAVSGGPVYVSDTLGRSRAEILKPLCFDDGKILRADNPAVPSKDCLTVDPVTGGKPFKIINTANGCGVLAVFNLNGENKSVSGSISSLDVEGICGEEFAFYEHFSKEFKIKKAGESFKITLKDNDDFKLYIIAPLENGNANIGRTDKFLSPVSFNRNADGSCTVIESGPFARVINKELVIKNLLGGEKVDF